ncbi:MAG: hypothetical protein SP1CHLAM54_04620 [Chlamydiia bacterium]|nr:hypothetical protein [Chlamydiia bacterium]MCH9615374.1 hypothetical protein [Chlamydiia bacterium]MCH9628304.1 hypothetical protein [Chlamydiia bacterium]
MHRIVGLVLILSLCTHSVISAPPVYDEGDFHRRDQTRPGFTDERVSDEAIGASMIGWGIGLAVGITVLVLLISPSTGEKDKSSNGGGSSHSHS